MNSMPERKEHISNVLKLSPQNTYLWFEVGELVLKQPVTAPRYNVPVPSNHTRLSGTDGSRYTPLERIAR